MDLQTFWFILIAVLFIGYFFLEGFDFGVGILMPIVSKDDVDRRITLNTIGPFWDANEVWLITAGGAMFAAFPHWYATLFSGFYLPFLLIVLALILRAIGFEFRSKLKMPWWRSTADQFVFWGSVLPAFLWGVALTNIVMGLPIGADMNFTGSLLVLLNPYALLGGLVSLIMFTLHGAIFLVLRTTGAFKQRLERVAKLMWIPAGIVLLIFALLGYRHTMLFDELGLVPGTLPMITIGAFVAVIVFIQVNRYGWAFAATGATIIFGAIVAFHGMFPIVMPSSLSADYNLTVYNASSSDLTLIIMSVIALIFVPITLAYQAWSYWVFRERVSREAIPES